jgi:hypothetical protein
VVAELCLLDGLVRVVFSYFPLLMCSFFFLEHDLMDYRRGLVEMLEKAAWLLAR